LVLIPTSNTRLYLRQYLQVEEIRTNTFCFDENKCKAIEYKFPNFYEAGKFHKNKVTFALLVYKKRRNHKTAWFCSIFIFKITTRNA